MPIIYIKNLPNTKVAVCRALFDAAAKTEAGKKEKSFGIQMMADMPGLWSPLADHEIEQALWSSRHNGFILDIGYLQVKLKFTLDSVDVTYYEKTYGITANTVLEAAGFTCSDKPISSPSSYEPHASAYTPLSGSLYAGSKSKAENKDQVDSKIVPYSKEIGSDRRFKKSTKHGVIFEAISMSYITDDDLIAYGAKTWTRKEDGIDNIVLISQMANKQEISQQPSKLPGMK